MTAPVQRTAAAVVGLFLMTGAYASQPQTATFPDRRPVLAVFAHPDDERVVGPLLSRLAREGRHVHLAIATDGSKGIRDFAGIPAGPRLAAVRAREADCAARRLGVAQLHLLGAEDGSLGTSMTILAEVRTRLSAVIAQVQPGVIITFGPEGGTGHPDHRLVGNLTTEIVQAGTLHRAADLYYASLPAERLGSAPQSTPQVTGVADELLTVRVPVEPRDIAAGRESFACHATQYTPSEMSAINRTLAHVWNGVAYLRPWNGRVRDPSALTPP
jgi:LmbE family N-acetylglucosaminyl deacetylase